MLSDFSYREMHTAETRGTVAVTAKSSTVRLKRMCGLMVAIGNMVETVVVVVKKVCKGGWKRGGLFESRGKGSDWPHLAGNVWVNFPRKAMVDKGSR